MANALPARPYGRILIATDLSDGSSRALAAAEKLGLLDRADIAIAHAFDAPAQGMIARSSMAADRMKSYLADEQAKAARDVEEFLKATPLSPARLMVRRAEPSIAATIRECARQFRADLIVVGTRGRSGLSKLILGSVAEEVLRFSEIDVLAVPPTGGQ
jgi:nucleotide-binding universal stress UspA family protein